MATIAAALGAPRRALPAAAASGPRAALRPAASGSCCIVVDGLGYGYLTRGHAGSSLRRHLRGSLTSVFPSTTATAITAFLTGLAPAQHGITGWHMYFPEIATRWRGAALAHARARPAA